MGCKKTCSAQILYDWILITKKMKIACVYHSADLDGWMSAAIVLYYYNKKNVDNNTTNEQFNFKSEGMHNEIPILFSDNSLNFIGYNHGQPIPDLSEYNQIIMCDISFSKEEMLKLYERLNSNFIWIDHHISAIKDNVLFNLEKGGNYHIDYYGIRDIEFAACELTWKHFFPNEEMPEIVRLLGRYDCFGHKGTNEEQKVLEFQYGARKCITNYEKAYHYLLKVIRDKKHGSYATFPIGMTTVNEIHVIGKFIYQYLCIEAEHTYRDGFAIKFTEEITDGIGKNIISRKFICINKERFNPINFGIDYHADGYDGCACFWYDNQKKIRFSLYNDNGEVDCSKIAASFGGGGHKGASGFITDTENLLKITNGNE